MGYQSVSFKASRERLEDLIRQRLIPGVQKDQVDQRIWDLFGETWAVMFTDLSGFSRGVAKFGIIHFLQTIYEAQRILIPVIEGKGGIMLKVEGDSYLVIFRKTDAALDCALEMQKILTEYNKVKTEEEKVLLCVGLGYGPMLRIGDEDVFGAEVNAASKLGEDTAKAQEILITEDFKNALKDDHAVGFSAIKEVPPGSLGAWKVEY
ncbi:MAG: adenylate cyclase [Spirochaetes bacterium GWB1_48_6]|nr:MAG: adenylate cyclase [Spirochaetes bacterium GWB1_48_6]